MVHKGDSNTNSAINSDISFENQLKTQFSQNDYSKILNYQQSALGSINLSNIDYHNKGFDNYTSEYPELNDDIYTYKALNISYIGTKLVKVISPVKFEDYNQEELFDYGYSSELLVRLNDSISVQYDYNKHELEGFLFYLPKLGWTSFIELWIENKTMPLSYISKEYIFNPDYRSSVLFYYKNYLNCGKCNFTLHIIYDLKIIIDTWNLKQEVNQELLIEEDEKSVSPKFIYNFYVRIYENNYNYLPGKFEDGEFAKNLNFNFTIFPPNEDSLYGHSLTINDEKVGSQILNYDNSIFTGFFNSSFFQGTRESPALIILEFFTTFSIDFEEPIDFSWAIDRLVGDDDIRERIYFPRIISGPSQICLKNVKILDDTIAFDQVISGSSIFERPVIYTEINVSQTEEETGQSLIFNEITTKRRGIKITMPYMILGEICPFVIKYETEGSLKIVVTDNIGLPISNVEVQIYYFGEEYGTYISNEKTQPLGPQITDENGEILLEKVPDGNYTVKVYYFNNVVKESEVSTFLEINYVPTTIIHIPIVVLIFGSIFGFVLIIGLFYRLRQEKSRNI